MAQNKRRFIRLEEIEKRTSLTKEEVLDSIDDGELNLCAKVEVKHAGAFTVQMGGVFCERKVQVFKPYYELSADQTTGEIKSSLYCEIELIRALKGVVTAGHELITRIFEWRIELQQAASFHLEFCE